MYTDWLKIPSLEPGEHTIIAGLFSNLHDPYYWTGKTLQDTITVYVEEHEAMHDDDKEHEMDSTIMPSDSPSMQGMLADGTLLNIWATKPHAGEVMTISIEFEDAQHVNHDLIVTQNGHVVLNDIDAHHHDGTGMHTTAPLPSSDPVDIRIVFTGYGMSEPFTGPAGEEVAFVNVVPEFGAATAVVLGAAVAGIVALGVRSTLLNFYFFYRSFASAVSALCRVPLMASAGVLGAYQT